MGTEKATQLFRLRITVTDKQNAIKGFRKQGEVNFTYRVTPPSTTAPATVPLQTRSQRPTARFVIALGIGGTATLGWGATSDTTLRCRH